MDQIICDTPITVADIKRAKDRLQAIEIVTNIKVLSEIMARAALSGKLGVDFLDTTFTKTNINNKVTQIEIIDKTKTRVDYEKN